jgi:hypothetical protein
MKLPWTKVAANIIAALVALAAIGAALGVSLLAWRWFVRMLMK